MVKVAIYGLTTEGYLLAKALSKKGYTVNMIDGKIQMGLEITEDLIKRYDNMEDWAKSDTPVGFKGLMSEIVRECDYLFFTPKMKEGGEESFQEALIRLKEIASHLNRGSNFINCTPLPLGKNFEFIELIEKVRGINVNEDFNYAYFPLIPRKASSYTLGLSDLKKGKSISNLIFNLGNKPLLASLSSSEFLHFKYVIQNYSHLVSEFELSGRVKGEETVKKDTKEFYVDDLITFLFDLKNFSLNLKPTEPLHYFCSGIFKSIDLYLKNLISALKNLLKIKELKLSRTRLLVSWLIDDYEIRGEKRPFLNLMVSKLRDHIGEATSLSKEQIKRRSVRFPDMQEKHNLIISCSSEDSSLWSELKDGNILVKANQFLV